MLGNGTVTPTQSTLPSGDRQVTVGRTGSVSAPVLCTAGLCIGQQGNRGRAVAGMSALESTFLTNTSGALTLQAPRQVVSILTLRNVGAGTEFAKCGI